MIALWFIGTVLIVAIGRLTCAGIENIADGSIQRRDTARRRRAQARVSPDSADERAGRVRKSVDGQTTFPDDEVRA